MFFSFFDGLVSVMPPLVLSTLATCVVRDKHLIQTGLETSHPEHPNNIDIDFMGAQAGAYLVGNTKGGLVYDTYFAGSVIENKMGVTTSLMTADSKYYSSMLTTGASITGSIQMRIVL